MRWLLFLSRVAFICGLFFLVSFSLLLNDWLEEGDLKQTIITIGYVMGMVVLPLTCLCYLLVLIIKRKLRAYVPLWLVVVNILFLASLIYFIFYLNDPYYNKQ